ncbi:unnamed protein product [Trichobilharzia regenti]|nr:unnamed protein product [Trichobilharzia regenti]
MMKRPIPEGESSDTSMESKPQKTSLNSLMISRLEEKEELQHLNDRLANYIEYLHKSIFGKELRSHVDLLTESLKVSVWFFEYIHRRYVMKIWISTNC